jgi:hypothetical protein
VKHQSPLADPGHHGNFKAQAAMLDIAENAANEATQPSNGTTLYYELEGMALIRQLVTGDKHGLSNQDMDGFKSVLAALEREGFELTGPDLGAK